jgi:hypothetical protein
MRRGQVEPTAALACVFAVGVGLSLYGAILGDALPTADRDLAEPTLRRVADELCVGGIASPDRLHDARRAGPSGYALNVSVRVGGRRWAVGPIPPPRADEAARRVSVRIGPGRVRPGALRVEVWT